MPLRYILPLAACLAACESSPTTAAGENAATTFESAAMSEAATPDQAKPTPAPYRLIGVYDPGLQLVAWAMKVPRAWRV